MKNKNATKHGFKYSTFCSHFLIRVWLAGSSFVFLLLFLMLYMVSSMNPIYKCYQVISAELCWKMETQFSDNKHSANCFDLKSPNYGLQKLQETSFCPNHGLGLSCKIKHADNMLTLLLCFFLGSSPEEDFNLFDVLWTMRMKSFMAAGSSALIFIPQPIKTNGIKHKSQRWFASWTCSHENHLKGTVLLLYNVTWNHHFSQKRGKYKQVPAASWVVWLCSKIKMETKRYLSCW